MPIFYYRQYGRRQYIEINLAQTFLTILIHGLFVLIVMRKVSISLTLQLTYVYIFSETQFDFHEIS